MNPDRIYRQHRDDALALQVAAPEYTTFVAMPFGERFSYRSREVFDQVICAAAARATERGEAARPFARPFRADDRAGVAGVISEDIIVDILESHFCVADLTFANPGVLIEAGAALGLKPTTQIILLLQGDPRDLHFDLRQNRAIRYDSPGAVEEIASAFIAAARAFEDDRQRYVESVTRSLSPDAIGCLRLYGTLWRNHPEAGPSLHRGLIWQFANAKPPIKILPDATHGGYWGAVNFTYVLLTDAMRELVEKRLMWTHYVPNATTEGDAFGLHATELGWVVITRLWPELVRPEGAPT